MLFGRGTSFLVLLFLVGWQLVFNDRSRMQLLNKAMRIPIMKLFFWQLLSEFFVEQRRVLVLDCPLLFEAKMSYVCQETVVVSCAKEVQDTKKEWKVTNGFLCSFLTIRDKIVCVCVCSIVQLTTVSLARADNTLPKYNGICMREFMCAKRVVYMCV